MHLSDQIPTPVPGLRRAGEGQPLVALLGLIANGDRVAFEELYRRTSPKLFGVCLRILSDRETAEDALQAAYLSIWGSAAQYDASRGSPMTWLLATARNRAIDRLRANRSIAAMPIDDVAERPDPDPIASDRLEAAAEAHRLIDCMTELEARDAAFIRAAFFQGSTYAELATRSTLPLGTVKSRIRRALLKLRDCLG